VTGSSYDDAVRGIRERGVEWDIDPTLDRIRDRFGATAVTRASSLDKPAKEDGFTDVPRRR
jgi:hypothetical protein